MGTIVLFFFLIVMLSSNSVFSLEFDNIKSFDKDFGEYGKVTIKDWFGLLDLTELELKTNTDVCVLNCSAEIEIIMYQDDVLIDEIRFMVKQEDESWKEGSIRNYQFYIKTNEEEYDVNDYETQCINGKYISKNDSYEQICNEVKIGSHKEKRNIYEEYELGTEVEPGTYYIRLEGEKSPIKTVDWQITSQGKLIDDWAIWSEGDFIDSWLTKHPSGVPRGIATDGNNIWVSVVFGAATTIEKYSMNGIYITNFTLNASNTAAWGITTNNTFIWTTDQAFNSIFKYDMDLNYILSTPTNVFNDNPRGMTNNDTNLFVVDTSPDNVYNYDMQGNHITNWTKGSSGSGSAAFGNFLYVIDSDSDIIQRNYTNSSARPEGNFDLNASNGDGFGMTTNGAFIWIVDTADDRIYKYYSGLGEITVSLGIPADETFSLDSPMFFNSTAIPGSGFNLTNATIEIYNSNQILINRTTKIVLGNDENSTNFSISNLPIDTLTWNFFWCADDTTQIICSRAIENRTLNYGIEQVFETFNSSVLETSNEHFILNLNLLSGFNIQKASLIYDDEIFTGATITGSGTNFNITRSIIIPQGTQGFSSENRTFIFNVTFVNDITGDVGNILIGENNQTVNEFSFGFCRTGLAIPMLNFTMVNEITNIELNASINATTFQATFEVGLDAENLVKNLSFNNITTNASRFNFCTGGGTNVFVVNMQSSYTAVGFVERSYFLNEATISNNTNEIDLFMMPDAIGVEFFIDVEQNLFPLTEATINIAKFFIGEGVFKTTEIDTTDGDGRITSFLDLNKDYRFTITKDGVLLGILEKRAICQAAPCTLSLSITDETPDIYSGFSEIFASQVLYNLSYDGGLKRVTFEFVDTTGLATSFRMDIIRGVPNGTGVLVSRQRLFTSSGSMTYNHTETSGDFIAKIFITRSPNQIIDYIQYLISDPSKVLGALGFFVAFLIVVTIIFGLAFHPPMFIMSIPLSLTLVKLMGIISLSLEAIIAFYLLAFVAIGFMSR